MGEGLLLGLWATLVPPGVALHVVGAAGLCQGAVLQAMAHVPAGAVIRLRTDCVAAHGALTKGAAEGGVRGMLVELFWAIVRLWVEGVLFAHCWLVECGCGLPFQDL